MKGYKFLNHFNWEEVIICETENHGFTGVAKVQSLERDVSSASATHHTCSLLESHRNVPL